MKKFLAVMLAMVMVLSLLAGCGSKSSKKSNKKDDDDDEKDKESTSDVSSDSADKKDDKNNGGNKDDDNNDGDTNNDSNSDGVDFGILLDKPEKTFDPSTYNEVFVSYTEVLDGKEYTTDIAIVKDGTTTVYYELSHGDASIAEETSEGFVGYYKSEDATEFKLSTQFGQDFWGACKKRVERDLKYFTDWQSHFNEDYQLRKTKKTVSYPTGPVDVYDVIWYDEVRGEIYVDQATGLIVYVDDNYGKYTVTQFQTSNVQLPAYK